jgi:hypothetical protein
VEFFPVDNARVMYTKGLNSKKKWTCAVWGARYTLGAPDLYIKWNAGKVWGARYLYIKWNAGKVWGARYTSMRVIYLKMRYSLYYFTKLLQFTAVCLWMLRWTIHALSVCVTLTRPITWWVADRLLTTLAVQTGISNPPPPPLFLLLLFKFHTPSYTHSTDKI